MSPASSSRAVAINCEETRRIAVQGDQVKMPKFLDVGHELMHELFLLTDLLSCRCSSNSSVEISKVTHHLHQGSEHLHGVGLVSAAHLGEFRERSFQCCQEISDL